MLDKPVEEIVYEDGKVVGVKSQGEVGASGLARVGVISLPAPAPPPTGSQDQECHWRPELFHGQGPESWTSKFIRQQLPSLTELLP